MANPVVSWAKDNPLLAGAAALAVVVVVMMATGGGGSEETDGASGGMGSAGVQAYYAAVAQQGQAGAAIQIAQIESNASTNKALIAANYGIETAKIRAPIEMYSVQSGYDYKMSELGAIERMAANNVNLENARIGATTALGNAQLAQQQNIAFKQINATKPSFLGQVLDAAKTIVPAVMTGGASLPVSAAIKLPSLGSPGQWV